MTGPRLGHGPSRGSLHFRSPQSQTRRARGDQVGVILTSADDRACLIAARACRKEFAAALLPPRQVRWLIDRAGTGDLTAITALADRPDAHSLSVYQSSAAVRLLPDNERRSTKRRGLGGGTIAGAFPFQHGLHGGVTCVQRHRC